MGILQKQILQIDRNLLPTIKGFLSDLTFKDGQRVTINEAERVVFRTYPIKIKYFYKSKLFRIEYNDGFETQQNQIELFIRNVGFIDLTKFRNTYSNRFVLAGNYTVLELQLISFHRFNEFTMNFDLE